MNKYSVDRWPNVASDSAHVSPICLPNVPVNAVSFGSGVLKDERNDRRYGI